MAISLSETIRNNCLTQISNAADAGAGAARLRIYDGTRPAAGGAVTNLLAELTMGDPAFAAASAGSMAANAITSDSSADATGTASWFRIVDSDDNFVLDGDVGTSGSDLNLNSVAISAGVAVGVTSLTITAPNP